MIILAHLILHHFIVVGSFEVTDKYVNNFIASVHENVKREYAAKEPGKYSQPQYTFDTRNSQSRRYVSYEPQYPRLPSYQLTTIKPSIMHLPNSLHSTIYTSSIYDQLIRYPYSYTHAMNHFYERYHLYQQLHYEYPTTNYRENFSNGKTYYQNEKQNTLHPVLDNTSTKMKKKENGEHFREALFYPIKTYPSKPYRHKPNKTPKTKRKASHILPGYTSANYSQFYQQRVK